MVNMTTYIKNTLLLCLMFCATIFVGCSDDDNDGVTPLPEGQGEVSGGKGHLVPIRKFIIQRAPEIKIPGSIGRRRAHMRFLLCRHFLPHCIKLKLFRQAAGLQAHRYLL